MAPRKSTAKAAEQDTPPETGDQAATETGSAPQAGASDAPAAKDATPVTAEASGGSAQASADPQQETGERTPRPGRMVYVIGPKQGRRRIGRSFHQEPTPIPADDLDETAFDALMADPLLAVSIVDP